MKKTWSWDFFFIFVGEKTWSWENFLKKNKKNSTLIREFRVVCTSTYLVSAGSLCLLIVVYVKQDGSC